MQGILPSSKMETTVSCRRYWVDMLNHVHCITFYYAYQGICWKPGKTSKFWPIQSTIQICTDFHENEAKNFFFKKKNSKWSIFQNGRFSKSPILEIFSRKFYSLVLGLVGLIDAKAINVTQPIWSWGCLTKGQKRHFLCFLAVFALMSDSLTTI